MATAAKLRSSRPQSVPHVVEASGPPALTRIHEAGINLAIWQRPVDASLQQATVALTQQGDDWRCALHRVEAHALREHGPLLRNLLPERLRVFAPAACNALLADVSRLVGFYLDATSEPLLDVSLARLTVPQCPRFHTDHVGVRMLHTWCGPGTEWLRNEDVDRRALRARNRTDAPPVRSPRFQVQRVGAFALALLRGSAASGNQSNGIVHRSPNPSGTPRLMLVVDRAHEDDDGHGSCSTAR